MSANTRVCECVSVCGDRESVCLHLYQPTIPGWLVLASIAIVPCCQLLYKLGNRSQTGLLYNSCFVVEALNISTGKKMGLDSSRR